MMKGDEFKRDGGKQRAALIFQDFPLALKAITEVGDFGCNKYERHSWKKVPDAFSRYTDALNRHYLAYHSGEVLDKESGLAHYAHFAWGVLATLQLMEERFKEIETN